MRSSLASAILAEAEGKRALTDEERNAFLSDVGAALVVFRHDRASVIEEELARRQRVLDSLDDAIAAMSLGLDEPPFPSESRASAALRDGTFPAMSGAIGTLISMRDAAATKVNEVSSLASANAIFAPLYGSRIDGRTQSLILHAAASWAALVDPAIQMRAGGPLTRFLDAVLADAIGDKRPSIATVHDFLKKRGREAIRCASETWTFQAD